MIDHDIQETVKRMIDRGGPDHTREEVSMSVADKEMKEKCYQMIDSICESKNLAMAENGDLDDYEGGI